MDISNLSEYDFYHGNLHEEFAIFLYDRTIILFDEEKFPEIAKQFGVWEDLVRHLVSILLNKGFMEMHKDKWFVLACSRVKEKLITPRMNNE